MIKLKKSRLLRFNKEKIKNKKVIVRVDFNVDLEGKKLLGIYRILKTKKTLEFLKEAKQIVLISHFGDPQKREEKYSFKNLIKDFEKILNIKLGFLEDYKKKPKEKFNLLENIRFFKGEKEKDINLAKNLTQLGEVYVNEAFSASHRDHTSITLIPKLLPFYYGFNFEEEIERLNNFLKEKNILLILGGAKISTKLPLIFKFLKRANLIFIGGAMSFTYLKAKNFEIGKSFYEKDIIQNLKSIYSPKILTPFDFVNQNKELVFLGNIKSEDILLDVGENSLNILFEEIKKAKAIIWNGPLGKIEEGFEKSTLKLVEFLAKLKNKKILIGGGDTLAFLEKKKIINKFKDVSTGGGAMLHYLAYETLPCFEK